MNKIIVSPHKTIIKNTRELSIDAINTSFLLDMYQKNFSFFPSSSTIHLQASEYFANYTTFDIPSFYYVSFDYFSTAHHTYK